MKTHKIAPRCHRCHGCGITTRRVTVITSYAEDTGRQYDECKLVLRYVPCLCRLALAAGPSDAVVQVWEDLHEERSGFFRAFWCAGPDADTGSPVVGYGSPGGSHRTIRATVAELRQLGYREPVYRDGRLIASGQPLPSVAVSS